MEFYGEFPSFSNTKESIGNTYIQFKKIMDQEKGEPGLTISGGRKSKKSLFESLKINWGLSQNARRTALLISLKFKELMHYFIENLPKKLNIRTGHSKVSYIPLLTLLD